MVATNRSSSPRRFKAVQPNAQMSILGVISKCGRKSERRSSRKVLQSGIPGMTSGAAMGRQNDSVKSRIRIRGMPIP